MNFIKKEDPQIYELIKLEEERLKEVLEMIPSENYPSKAVLEALGSILNVKYSEGFPKKRYYQGNKIIDQVEILCQERAKKLFGVPYVNVQALSGSPANLAVYFALLESSKDKVMGLSTASGGHITHGHPLGFLARFFKPVHYELGKDGLLDYEEIERIAIREKPKIIICGYTAYPRIIDFKRFGETADKVGAYLMADISHITGLIVGGVHPSPIQYAHVITTTTHKTLRGPRGALIMVTEKGMKKNPDFPKSIDTAIIPGLQGGPHQNQTAAIAVALLEASDPKFKQYAKQIILNSKALAEGLINYGFELVSGGTDNHLLLVDLRNKKVNGAVAAYALEQANIVTNKNLVLNDTMPAFYPSGVRIGPAAVTSRGMKEPEMKKIAAWINEVIEEIAPAQLPEKEERKEYWKKVRLEIDKNKKIQSIAKEIKILCSSFPIP